MTRVTILAGEGEYGSHEAMRIVAADLREQLGAEISYRTPDVLDDYPEFPESTFGGLDELRTADLLVIYTRFRRLPDDEMAALRDYGGPVIGLRTSTHAFHYPPGSVWESWNDGFGRDVLGSPWISHHGHSSSTDVSRYPGVDHPVLTGIDQFRSRSWLYRVDLSPGCIPLLHGDPVDPEDEPTPGAVAWVRDNERRVFYASLGHPEDFELPEFRRLLVNAAGWCVKQ
jgi:hypothetical protein